MWRRRAVWADPVGRCDGWEIPRHEYRRNNVKTNDVVLEDAGSGDLYEIRGNSSVVGPETSAQDAPSGKVSNGDIVGVSRRSKGRGRGW